MGWAAFWAIFSQTHLVTLVPTQKTKQNAAYPHFTLVSDSLVY
jgi:hypothetical protein